MTTSAVIAAVRDDLYAAEWAAFYAATDADLPPRESQADPADDADADPHGPDGLTDGERGYREATDEATRERAAQAEQLVEPDSVIGDDDGYPY